jgi:hypothetical protein
MLTIIVEGKPLRCECSSCGHVRRIVKRTERWTRTRKGIEVTNEQFLCATCA